MKHKTTKRMIPATNPQGAGWPSQTGNPSGGGRDNAPPRK